MVTEETTFDVVQTKLTKDMREAAARLSHAEARYLVDYYYTLQDSRTTTANQIRALGESKEPHELIRYMNESVEKLEGNLRKALDIYSSQHVVGSWAKTITGIGPVISAGLLANIDIRTFPTAGRIHRYCGLDPTIEWLGKDKAKAVVQKLKEEHEEMFPGHGEQVVGNDLIALAAVTVNRNPERFLNQTADKDLGYTTVTSLTSALAKRPWNARLKVLCWNIGECFVRSKGSEHSFYGKLYDVRKAYETKNNDDGKLADQAKKKLETVRIGKSTDAYKYYSAGKLPPAHIHARAKRWVVKLFLSHWHTVAWESVMGNPVPKPWVLVHGGHTDYIAPPNWPIEK